MTKLPGRITMPPYLVIRPSGVWDSRAPFTNFLDQHHDLSKSYHLQSLVGLQTLDSAKALDPLKAAKQLFPVSGSSRAAARAWTAYRRSFGRAATGDYPTPCASDLVSDLRASLYDIREAAVIRWVSLFEAFAQCWALNYLLARLEAETGEKWTQDEQQLAEEFSPVHGKSNNVPGWRIITKRIPELRATLEKIAHVRTDLNTGQEVQQPVSSSLNAWAAINLWHDFRNLVVHRSGVISRHFHDKHAALFDEIRAPYAEFMPPLEIGHRVQMFDDVPRAIATVLYRSALRMKEWLEVIAGERRGHSFAPGPRQAGDVKRPDRAPVMLLQGDHPASYSWATEENFRREFRARHSGQS